MKVAFRTDASLHIGSGHVMRCLTLAEALKGRGADCRFIVREHPGHLAQLITQRGFVVTTLPTELAEHAGDARNCPGSAEEPVHARWLGCDWSTDARQTVADMAMQQSDWLVVDHYGLDRRWENAVRPHCGRLMVIDDLADRPHDCDLLVDQNLGRGPQDYAGRVPAECEVLAGSRFALLRPEFASLRPYSLERHQTQPALRRLLVTMGGVDRPNATGQVLQLLGACAVPQAMRITVVMGAAAPWLEQVREQAAQMPWPTDVVVGVTDMARRMADSDLAIGAAGTTSWERCCLGLPTLLVALADNQWAGAQALHEAGAARLLGTVDDLAVQLPPIWQAAVQERWLRDSSAAAGAVTDGLGTGRVLRAMGFPDE